MPSLFVAIQPWLGIVQSAQSSVKRTMLRSIADAMRLVFPHAEVMVTRDRVNEMLEKKG